VFYKETGKETSRDSEFPNTGTRWKLTTPGFPETSTIDNRLQRADKILLTADNWLGGMGQRLPVDSTLCHHWRAEDYSIGHDKKRNQLPPKLSAWLLKRSGLFERRPPTGATNHQSKQTTHAQQRA